MSTSKEVAPGTQILKVEQAGSEPVALENSAAAAPVEGAPMAENLSTNNRSRFEILSEKAANIATKTYEGIYKIPGVNRLVGKMEIFYNQAWMNRHTKVAEGHQDKIQGIDSQIGILDQTQAAIESSIATFNANDIAGNAVDSLRAELSRIASKRAGLELDKSKTELKVEARAGKVEYYANERDRVADKLITGYDEKLKPIEDRLGALKTEQEDLDFEMEVTAAKHESQKNQHAKIEQEKARLEENLKLQGKSDKEIAVVVKSLNDVIVQGRAEMEQANAGLTQRHTRLTEKVKQVEGRTKVYQHKRKEFELVKAGRPRDLRANKTEEAQSAAETTTVNTETTAEDNEKVEKIFTSQEFVNSWNEYLQKSEGVSILKQNGRIEFAQFVRKARLSTESRFDLKFYKKILPKYYALLKIPGLNQATISAAVQKFIEQQKA